MLSGFALQQLEGAALSCLNKLLKAPCGCSVEFTPTFSATI